MRMQQTAHRAKVFVLSTIIFLLTAPISNAQYVKAVKGDTVPFDTAVIVGITSYRAEGEKLRLCAQGFASYDKEVTGLYDEIATINKIQEQTDSMLASQGRTLAIKEQTIKDLGVQFKEMQKLALNCRRTWWTKNKIWVGLVAGLAAGYYISTIK